MPRVNVAWDIDGQGNNVLRGGYGLFFNRNMGNVEYDHALQLPPAAYAHQRRTSCDGAELRRTAVGLTYDTLPTRRRWRRGSARSASTR